MKVESYYEMICSLNKRIENNYFRLRNINLYLLAVNKIIICKIRLDISKVSLLVIREDFAKTTTDLTSII